MLRLFRERSEKHAARAEDECAHGSDVCRQRPDLQRNKPVLSSARSAITAEGCADAEAEKMRRSAANRVKQNRLQTAARPVNRNTTDNHHSYVQHFRSPRNSRRWQRREKNRSNPRSEARRQREMMKQLVCGAAAQNPRYPPPSERGEKSVPPRRHENYLARKSARRVAQVAQARRPASPE